MFEQKQKGHEQAVIIRDAFPYHLVLKLVVDSTCDYDILLSHFIIENTIPIKKWDPFLDILGVPYFT